MNLTVFGATGATGRLVVRAALACGDSVTAFARRPERLADLGSERLTVVFGELRDVEAVTCAIRGADAVISVLGPGARVRETAVSDGMRNVTQVMQTLGVARLVALATASVPDAHDAFDPRYRLLVSAVRLVYPGAYREVRRLGDAVRSSTSDWTLVRIGLLTNRESLPVRIGHYGTDDLRLRISRASLAELLVELVHSNSYVHEAPAVSN